MEKLTSRKNPLFTRVVKLQGSRKQRRIEGAFVGDGTKLLQEAVKWAPQRLETVIVQTGVECPELPAHVRAVEVPPALMAQISRMEAPEGAMFVCTMPPQGTAGVKPGCLVLEGVQDPGNVGTILRTADALDIHVILLEGCADPYNEKTVRATMGAIFRNPPAMLTRSELVEQCREKNIPLLATALTDGAKDLRSFDLRRAAVVIGSEGQGVSRELLEASDGQIIIPMTPRCESLNAAVASAIVLWQMTSL